MKLLLSLTVVIFLSGCAHEVILSGPFDFKAGEKVLYDVNMPIKHPTTTVWLAVSEKWRNLHSGEEPEDFLEVELRSRDGKTYNPTRMFLSNKIGVDFDHLPLETWVAKVHIHTQEDVDGTEISLWNGQLK